jgi:murein DD-endopeptidase MepM/ murein hydrolase activator NlpD
MTTIVNPASAPSLPRILMMTFLALLLLATGGWLGYGLGQGERRTAEDTAPRADLAAVTLRLGELQARLLRLEALGMRLGRQTGLSDSEFAFSEPPALGGPLASPGAPALGERLQDLAARLLRRETQLDVLATLLDSGRRDAQRLPSGLPVQDTWIASVFGPRSDPFTGSHAMHEGVDLPAPSGTEIVAVADGVVMSAGMQPEYGRVVEIAHADGYLTRYAHTRKTLVKPGDTVRKGQVIALVGSSGRATGPHLHFEVLQNGRVVDPEPFLAEAHPAVPGVLH